MSNKKVNANNRQKIKPSEENLKYGIVIVNQHPIFSRLYGEIITSTNKYMGKNIAAVVQSSGYIYVNKDTFLTPKEWAYAIAHCQLHLAFGHFDAEKMPRYEKDAPEGTRKKIVSCNIHLWNAACDIYIAKFLSDIKFGTPLCADPVTSFPGSLTDELKIYDYLVQQNVPCDNQKYSTADSYHMDMEGLEKPIIYNEKNQEHNRYAACFAYALAESVTDVVSDAGGHERCGGKDTPPANAARWFIDHYPLLGGLAASFKIVEDSLYCQKNEIQIAAVDASLGEIYINPAAGFQMEEWKFVLAHEYLHAGLSHHQRCQGRDPYLWNIACDFVINGWLLEMQIGTMPEVGLLLDEKLKGMSAEAIYDTIQSDLRKYLKMNTFRGYGKGDVIKGKPSVFSNNNSHTTLDDFYKNALMQGLEYHTDHDRGFIPAGLLEEIRALAMPPIPWDVKLAKWFDCFFTPLEKHRTYARPSRRQGATPDIPRPRYVLDNIPTDSRTFGVVVDTSGSVSAKQIGMALGSIASYAASKDVPLARVIFCDAEAYDAGYLAPEDIAGRVTVQGRGGTILQPGVDLLEQAKDFPQNGPILIITDGYIEENLRVKHAHAFLIPYGNRLPFRAKGAVFYFKE